ncbi:hypothetical protein UFOVP116_241 [uncultured Caudovirales phage]|uniref:Uncharacterized protein n=1 Tax=uncultured Caudovirales phage TaxID=2100421 RepID=A0A6J5L9R8_9CAUD|nr:hypothetical protein UFOVP116_241 [uncultured Caudovirales phage]
MKIQILASEVNDSGIKVSIGQTISVKVDPGLVWTDLNTNTNADGYASPNLILKLASFLKDCPSANWFTLCAKVNNKVFPLGCKGSFVAPEDGVLYFLANDVPWMRWNNLGKLEVDVKVR